MRTPLEGANSVIYAAVNPELKGISGMYFKDCKDGYTTAAARYDTSVISQWVSFLHHLWEPDTLGNFPPCFYKEDNFGDFVPAFCPSGTMESKFFPLTVDPFSEGRRKSFDKLPVYCFCDVSLIELGSLCVSQK